jgi:hypothetical protein
METLLAKDYAVACWEKTNPSDGSGARYRNKNASVELLAERGEDEISAIFLTSQFAGDLPNGLHFKMSRTEVQKLFGKTDWSLKKGGTGIMTITNSADKWWLSGGDALCVEYAEDEKSIKMLSVASIKTEAKLLMSDLQRFFEDDYRQRMDCQLHAVLETHSVEAIVEELMTWFLKRKVPFQDAAMFARDFYIGSDLTEAEGRPIIRNWNGRAFSA